MSSRNLGALTSWNPLGHSRPVMGLLYLTKTISRWPCAHCRGANNSLALPGRKQARKHVRDARDINNIETRALIKFFFFLQGKASKEIHAVLTETTCFLSGRAKALSASLYVGPHFFNTVLLCFVFFSPVALLQLRPPRC